MSSIRASFVLCAIVSIMVCVATPSMAEQDEPPPRDCSQDFENAQRLRKSGKLKAAAESLIACSQPTCHPFIAKECTNIYSEVQASLPSITVRATNGPGQLLTEVAVYLDGELLTKVLDGRAMPLDPGVHELRFVPEGKPEQKVKLLVAEGEKNKLVSVDFARPEAGNAPQPDDAGQPMGGDRPLEKKPGPPIAAYVVGGLGVAVLGAGVAVRLVAEGDHDHLQETCAPNCTDDKVDALDLKYNLSYAAFAVGGAAVLTGGILWLVHGSGATKSASIEGLSLRPVTHGNGMFASWRGRF